MNLLKDKLPARHWLMVAFTIILFGIVAAFVDLKPQVGVNFFFSSNDPKFQESAKIDRIFPSGSQLIVSVASPRISSERYLQRLAQLTRQLQSVETVTSVESLADGPKNFEDAEKSPFWKRLLIAENGRSSNVVVFASNRDSQRLISRVEAIVNKFDAKDFRIQIAGAPYVAEMIRQNLRHDFKTFSLTCFLLFGGAMWVLFRSWKLTLGMLATCTSAVLATLLVQSMFGEKIGILTANLGTIVFVVALSHLVYMTFNWQTLAGQGKEDSHDLGAKAWRMTLPASSFLVDGLRFAWIRELVDGAGEAAARTRLRWRGGNDRGAGVRLRDVSGVLGLGGAQGNQNGGQRSRGPFLGGEVRVDVGGYRAGKYRFEFRSDAVEHRSESA